MAVPPDFVAGQVLTAAQMNQIGFWLVKTQTVGTGVSAVTVTDAFNADYTNYQIVITGITSTVTPNLDMTLGSTTTGYYYNNYYQVFTATALNGENGSNQAAWLRVAAPRTNGCSAVIDIQNPFVADETTAFWKTLGVATGGLFSQGGGYLANTTSYTAFTLTLNTGTMTGGTIHVYGYRD